MRVCRKWRRLSKSTRKCSTPSRRASWRWKPSSRKNLKSFWWRTALNRRGRRISSIRNKCKSPDTFVSGLGLRPGRVLSIEAAVPDVLLSVLDDLLDSREITASRDLAFDEGVRLLAGDESRESVAATCVVDIDHNQFGRDIAAGAPEEADNLDLSGGIANRVDGTSRDRRAVGGGGRKDHSAVLATDIAVRVCLRHFGASDCGEAEDRNNHDAEQVFHTVSP